MSLNNDRGLSNMHAKQGCRIENGSGFRNWGGKGKFWGVDLRGMAGVLVSRLNRGAAQSNLYSQIVRACENQIM